MDAQDRLRHALAAVAHAKFFEDGVGMVQAGDTDSARADARATERDLEIVLRELVEQLFLEDKHHGMHFSTPFFALWYETEVNRTEFHARNELRRKMLGALREADEGGYAGFDFSAAEEGWTALSRGELSAAGKTLEALGLAEIRVETSGYVSMKITGEGLRVAIDPRELARMLPVSAADDAELGAEIVSDALRPLILDCEQLLRERGWTEALNEVEEGDTALADERWRDAVREYYRAVESALKYRLSEGGIGYADSTALRPLASLAAQNGLIPRNYQELFGFLNSIRSPKSHGAGPAPQDVPIGRNEALLMGNHARALLLYLGGTAT
jgi:hypothetical protein